MLLVLQVAIKLNYFRKFDIMNNVTLNIPFNALMLSEAGATLTPIFKSTSNDKNIYREGRIYDSLTTLYSPLTNAVYVIRLIKRMSAAGQWYAHGIQLEFSPPLVTVGNDYLIDNDSELTRRVAELLLKNFVKVCGVPAASVLFFDIVNTELADATTSLLVQFPSHAEAASAVELLRERANALHNFGWQAHYGAEGQLLPFNGNTGDGFWKFGDSGYHLHFYAIGDIDLCFDSRHDLLFFQEPLINPSSAYIKASKCYVKFDLILTRKWFDGKGSHYRYIFNKIPKNIDYETRKIVNRIFAVSRKFRQTILPDEEVSRYHVFVQDLLRSYFAGENILDMLQFTCNTRVDGKYPALRRMLIKHWHIDISVPWKLHQSIHSKNVKAQLEFADHLKLTKKYSMSVFSQKSATKFLPELERLVE